jgi:hypothetical protein
MGFVRQTVAELARRKIPPEEGPASKTLRWFDYFVEFFLEAPHSIEHDDLLFFVRDNASPSEEPVFVKRLESSKVPRLEGLVQWEETFYLNLLARMTCQLRLTACTEEMFITKQLVTKVFAAPTKTRPDSCEYSFPQIYFQHEGVIDITNGTLIVELRALLDDGDMEDATLQTVEYTSWQNTDNAISLFQGAVSYSALAAVHRRKTGMRISAPASILMKGPSGRGYANVQVTDPAVAHMDTLDLVRNSLRKIATRDHSNRTLRCHLEYIQMHWRLIIIDLFRYISR